MTAAAFIAGFILGAIACLVTIALLANEPEDVSEFDIFGGRDDL